jgi:hypothetical protein
MRTPLLALIATLTAGTAFAADLPGRKSAPTPPPEATSCKETSATAISSDIFGFTIGSDVSDVAAWNVAGTYGGAFRGGGFKPGGFKPGGFNAHTGQLQVTTSFLPCWEFAPYIQGSTGAGNNRFNNGRIKLNSLGVGVEQKYKILGRATHGIGLTLDWDINYQGYKQTDTTVAPTLSTSGGQVTSSYRLFIDKELINGKLFGAINATWDQVWFERPNSIAPIGGDFARTSTLGLSTSLSYQLVDGFFLGGEARYLRTHVGNFFNKYTGDAVYLGPTMYWQATKSLAISGAWGIQVAGNNKAVFPAILGPQYRASDVNLLTQNQHLAKIKVSYSF